MVTFESHWLVRDDNGKVKVFVDKPTKNERGEWWCNYDGEIERGMVLRGYDDKYNYVTEENSPVEIHFITPTQFKFYAGMC